MKNDIEIHMYIKSLCKITQNLEEELKKKDEEIEELKKKHRDLEHTMWVLMVVLIIIIGVIKW